MKRFLFTYIFLILAGTTSAQDLDQEGFIKALTGDGDVRQYISEDELQSSERLGITYYDEKEKFLIGYGLPEEIHSIIKTGRENYELSYPMTGNGYGALTLTVPSENYKQIFYFKNDKYISPLTFHTRNYTKKESDFFRFYIDDTTYFNDYCIRKLDEYVDGMLRLMEFTALEREILINEKFNYVLCKDGEEIKLVTGFDTRGMYVKAYDAVVTTFNTHYHEVAHGLMYFKQKTDIKPELLFFQEGFATALGGRGGEAFGINLGLGYYLVTSNLVSYHEIFSTNDFNNAGASISYNLASIYNFYILVNGINFSKYMEIYNRFSGSSEEVDKIVSSDLDITEHIELKEYSDIFKPIVIKYEEKESKIVSNDDFSISANFVVYGFKTNNSLLISEGEPIKNYISKKFVEIFPGREYKGEKYYISVNPDDISVYNLYTNELIAMYAKGFSKTGESVTFKDGYYEFSIALSVFEDILVDLKISTVK